MSDARIDGDTPGAFVDRDPAAMPGSGPLADLTIGIKANIMVAGLPWTGGMAVHRDRIAARDADVVARLRRAGAAILGTLNMHEAALGATTDNPWFGRTHNAHRHGYTPGGSSGGSGAAVAGGLCDAALGTDTMGSVRIPAAYNGVYGLKPTHGAVSQDGLEMLLPSFDCIGPLARDLEVLERIWRVLRCRAAGSSVDAGSRMPLGLPPAREHRIVTLTGLADVETQPAVRAAYDHIVARLGTPIAITLPHSPPAVRMAGFVDCVHYLLGQLGDLRRTQADLISPELHFMLDYGERATPQPQVLAETRAFLVEALGDDGVLVMPTAPQAAFAHTPRPPANQSDFTCLASVAGLPALAIPAGLDDDALPVGVQLVGPADSEARLFAVARQLAETTMGDVR